METIKLSERLKTPDYRDTKKIKYGTISIDNEKCTQCFLCLSACPAGAIEKTNDGPLFRPGESECIYCGNCQAVCPVEAVALLSPYSFSDYFKTIDRGKPEPPRLFSRK